MEQAKVVTYSKFACFSLIELQCGRGNSYFQSPPADENFFRAQGPDAVTK